jgi:phospholipid/cholesterol/gamma-HCH transport system substrate-binding protein
MLTREPRLRRRLIGIGMLALLAIGIFLAATRPNPFVDRRTIWAEFDNVNGLGSIDRDIRVAGVNEGEIGEVIRVGDDALVELEVNEEVEVHADAQVALRPHTLFEGSAFVDLHPGSPSAPAIDDGGTIPRGQTEVYVSFDEALRVLRTPVRRSLRELAVTTAAVLSGDATESLQRTLTNTPELTRELGPTARALQGSGGVELQRAIRSGSETIAALAGRESSLVPLAERANRTLAALDVDAAGPLDRALAGLPGPLETLRDRGELLTALIDRTGALAVELRPALVELAPALDQLQPILRDATPAIRRAVPLVRAIGTVLRRATSAAPALVRLLDTLRPTGPILGERVLPSLHRESKLGIPTYLQLVSAFAGGDAALRPYQTEAQGQLGTGHMIRLGAYFDPSGSSGFGDALPCDLIAELSPELAAGLQVGGFCA